MFLIYFTFVTCHQFFLSSFPFLLSSFSFPSLSAFLSSLPSLAGSPSLLPRPLFGLHSIPYLSLHTCSSLLFPLIFFPRSSLSFPSLNSSFLSTSSLIYLILFFSSSSSTYLTCLFSFSSPCPAINFPFPHPSSPSSSYLVFFPFIFLPSYPCFLFVLSWFALFSSSSFSSSH